MYVPGVLPGTGRLALVITLASRFPFALSVPYSSSGALVPLSAVSTVSQTTGPLTVNHAGQLPAVPVSFNLAPGVALGDATTAVQRIAGNGTGDTRWKVPGVLDWSTGVYNPRVDITQDTTTLYASDRDVFLFLVDDLNPIEAGQLADGSPDLYFRGFYCWNSEVGAKTLGIASFYLRAVCQNRNLWGVEDFQEPTIRHSKYAASRFAHEAAPALTRFANSSAVPFVNGIKAARERIVARTDEERTEFLRKRGFGKAETAKIIDIVLTEEGRKPESIFDFVQGITAVARDKPHQDARLDLEAKAKKLLDRAA